MIIVSFVRVLYIMSDKGNDFSLRKKSMFENFAKMTTIVDEKLTLWQILCAYQGDVPLFSHLWHADCKNKGEATQEVAEDIIKKQIKNKYYYGKDYWY